MNAQKPRGVEITRLVDSSIGWLQPGVVGDAIYWSEQRPLHALVRIGRHTVNLPQDVLKPIDFGAEAK
jgi:hypothetical protein